MSEERLINEWEWQARREAMNRWMDDGGTHSMKYYVNTWDSYKPVELGRMTYEETRRLYNNTIDLSDENAALYGRLAINAIQHGEDGKARLWANLAATEAHRADDYAEMLRQLEETNGES